MRQRLAIAAAILAVTIFGACHLLTDKEGVPSKYHMALERMTFKDGPVKKEAHQLIDDINAAWPDCQCQESENVKFERKALDDIMGGIIVDQNGGTSGSELEDLVRNWNARARKFLRSIKNC